MNAFFEINVIGNCHKLLVTLKFDTLETFILKSDVITGCKGTLITVLIKITIWNAYQSVTQVATHSEWDAYVSLKESLFNLLSRFWNILSDEISCTSEKGELWLSSTMINRMINIFFLSY